MKICFILGSELCAFFPDKWLKQSEQNRVWHLTFWISSISFHRLFGPLELRTVWSSWAALRLWARLLSSRSPRQLLCSALPLVCVCGSGHGGIHREGEWDGVCGSVFPQRMVTSPRRHGWKSLTPGVCWGSGTWSQSGDERERDNAWIRDEVIEC